MVDKLKTILQMIRDDKHDVLLFAALKLDEISDRWSIIYVESGTNSTETKDENKSETFKYLADKLLANLSKEESRSIARVVVSSLENHLVINLLKFKAGTEFKESTPVNGNIVHEGYILASG